MNVKKVIKSLIGELGYKLIKVDKDIEWPIELTNFEREIVNRILRENLSMTSIERLCSTVLACRYVIERKIEGDFVECGVWRGGHALIAAKMFKNAGVNKRVYLYDTFEGMTLPSEKDVKNSNNELASKEFFLKQKQTHNEWCYASIEDVKENFEKWGVLSDEVIFIKGDVCQTLDIKELRPREISILRLDTDWYESTKKELEVLYPNLVKGGVLAIDDYGHWAGSKQATDEYFTNNRNRPFFQCADYSGRIAIKID
jgi:hypothetical protein